MPIRVIAFKEIINVEKSLKRQSRNNLFMFTLLLLYIIQKGAYMQTPSIVGAISSQIGSE